MTALQIAAILSLLLAFNVPPETVSKVEAILKPPTAAYGYITEMGLSVSATEPIEKAELVRRSCEGNITGRTVLDKAEINTSKGYQYGWAFKSSVKEYFASYDCSVEVVLQKLLGASLVSNVVRRTNIPARLDFK